MATGMGMATAMVAVMAITVIRIITPIARITGTLITGIIITMAPLCMSRRPRRFITEHRACISLRQDFRSSFIFIRADGGSTSIGIPYP